MNGPVVFSSMNDFIGTETYYGPHYRSTVDTSTERDSIIQTISPDEVAEIRCDGVVEYAYEWNNFWV